MKGSVHSGESGQVSERGLQKKEKKKLLDVSPEANYTNRRLSAKLVPTFCG
jgi:hypothetical protein